MEPARGGVLGAALRDPQLVVLSGHFPHVETEAQVGAEPGVQARECALPGPGSWGSGAPRWGTLREPGSRCALRSWGGRAPRLWRRLQELPVTCWDSHFSHPSDTMAPWQYRQGPGTLPARALSAVLESSGGAGRGAGLVAFAHALLRPRLVGTQVGCKAKARAGFPDSVPRDDQVTLTNFYAFRERTRILKLRYN